MDGWRRSTLEPRRHLGAREPAMKQWLIIVTEHAIVVIDALALVIILVGTLEAFVCGLRTMLAAPTGHERRDIWLRYARWLVAGLTFQLAADIIETSITTDWDAVGRIAAVAVIRTFLNYFLERDLNDVRERERQSGELPKSL
jgi:uncharacterized membrane protein